MMCSQSGLIGDVDCDGLALGVVKPVHGSDGGQHGEAVQQDAGEQEHGDDTHPDSLGEEWHAVPPIRELVVHDVEWLQL